MRATTFCASRPFHSLSNTRRFGMAKETLWQVFISYRSTTDGGKPDKAARVAARWLHERLNDCVIELKLERPRETSVRLNAYLDQDSPASSDFKHALEPHLQTSKALVLVCTEGAANRRKGRDFLYDEIEWWVRKRRASPILIDAADVGEAGVPGIIRRRFDRATLLELRLAEWEQLEPEQAAMEEKRLLIRILKGIEESEFATTYEDLERARRRVQMLLALSLVLVLALAGVGLLGGAARYQPGHQPNAGVHREHRGVRCAR